MKILLTNDDGVFAPGLAAMHRQLSRLGEVHIVAPATEQSGVGHSITYLTPLTAKSIYRDGRHWAWAVNGSPADCVKLAIAELFKDDPVDLVVSGINSGLNCGISVLYSGTVAAAIEGAFFGTTSMAVSLEYDEEADFDAAAELAGNVVGRIAAESDARGKLFNLNIPTAATRGPSELRVVPMSLGHFGSAYEQRRDPEGRPYYWALWTEPEQLDPGEADILDLRDGHMTLTPLHFDLTDRRLLDAMRDWNPPFPHDQSPSRIAGATDTMAGLKFPDQNARKTP